MDKELREAIMNEMTNCFPFFAYCAGGWKVHAVLSKWYLHWRGRQELKKKQGNGSSNSGNEEDDFLGDGSPADTGNVSMAIDHQEKLRTLFSSDYMYKDKI